MTAIGTAQATVRVSLSDLLRDYTIEIMARDARSLESLRGRLQAGSEVFVANPASEEPGLLVEAALRLREAGFVAVPHIVARNIRDRKELDELVARLAGEAGVDRVLALGGDRDRPAGAFAGSLDLIEAGTFERHGVTRLRIACYPEGHPRIGDEALSSALSAKLTAAEERGFDVRLVSQFAFDAEPILAFARRLRAAGISAPLQVGVAGPARRTTLIKYAMRCGVGASIRTLMERKHLVSSFLAGETPEELLNAITLARKSDPSLGIVGVHFFTFGAPHASAEWVRGQQG